MGPISKETTMQFVMMIYHGTTPLPGTDAWKALPAREQKRIYAEYAEFAKTPGVTPGLPLGLPTNAKTVRVSNGSTLIADGPYAAQSVGATTCSKPTTWTPQSSLLQRFPRPASAAGSRCARSQGTGDKRIAASPPSRGCTNLDSQKPSPMP